MNTRSVSHTEHASTSDPVRILIVEDNLADYELAQREIRASIEACLFERVMTEGEYLNTLESFQPDLVLADYSLPKFDGLKALKLLQQRSPFTPLILWTGSLSEETAVESMKAGANNYVIKENIKRLGPAVLHALEERRIQLDRDKAQQGLIASETRFRSLIENSSDEVSIIAANGSLLYESPSANPTLGYRPGEFLGRDLFQLMHPDDLPKVKEQFAILLANPEFSPRIRFRLRHQNGSWRWVEAVGRNLLGEASVGGIVVNYHEVTEQVQAEIQLKYHARLLRYINDAVIATDDQFIITAWNRAAEAMYGWKSEEALGRNVTEILSFDFSDEQRAEAREQLTSSLTVRSERVHRHRNGQILYVETNTIALIDEHHKLTGYVSVNRDVTERRLVEDALRGSEERFSKSFHNSPLPMTISRLADGRFVEVNRSYASLVKYPREALIGRTALEMNLWADPAERDRIMQSIQVGIALLDQEIHFITALGEIRTAIAAYEVIELNGAAHLLGLYNDITARRQAEESLRTSEKRYRALFEDTPIAIWEEDFSHVKKHIDGLKSQGITDFGAYFTANPEVAIEWTNMIRILNVNRSALLMYRAESKEQLINSTEKVLSKGERLHLQEDLIAIASGRISNSWEGSDETITGDPIEITLNWSVAPGYEHDYSKVIVSTVDITDRKRAEARVLSQVQRLNALRDIDRTITSTFDLRLSLDFLISRAVAILEVDAASILLVNTTLNTLEYSVRMGFRAGPTGSLKIRLGEGFAGKAALERETIHIQNMADYPNAARFDFYVTQEGVVEYYAVPLVAKGKILGVLEVLQRTAIDHDPEWLDFLQSLAESAAIAIDNAQAFEGMQRSNMELIMAYDATIAGWSHAMDLRDKETEGHTQRVTELTVKLAQRMGMTSLEQIQLQRGALLHDIGKLGIPDSILLKPDKLTAEEWEIMKQHPVHARDMLSSIVYLRPAMDIPYCHHEKWDGTGYPQGLTGEQIPLTARLFAVVDVWDALTSDRPYRPAWTREAALDYIREQSGKHFDPRIVDTFLAIIS